MMYWSQSQAPFDAGAVEGFLVGDRLGTALGRRDGRTVGRVGAMVGFTLGDEELLLPWLVSEVAH